MLTPAEIRERRVAAKLKIKEAEAALHLAHHELEAVIIMCPHPNAVEWQSGDYSGDTYMMVRCDDCGLRKQGTLQQLRGD